MNSTSLKEAQATGYPREKMYGVWWAGAEPDVKDVGDGAKGYNALAMQHGAEPNAKVVKEVLEKLHAKGQGTGPKEEVGQVLYMRGLISAMLQVEGVRAAQGRYGKGKRITGEQMRWGLENLNLDQKTLDGMGFGRRDASGADLLPRPHGFGLGAHAYLGRQEVELHFRLVPGRREGAASDGDAGLGKYAEEKKIKPRTPEDCKK
jgi:branched-chain amino acid transport system substrate-binding protein